MFQWSSLLLVSVGIKIFTTIEGMVIHSTIVWLGCCITYFLWGKCHPTGLTCRTHIHLLLCIHFLWSRSMQSLGLLYWLMFSAIHTYFNPFYAALFFFWLKSFIPQVIYLIKQLLSCNFSVKNLQCDRAEERGWLKIKHYQVKAHATSCVSYSAILWSLIFFKRKAFQLLCGNNSGL